MCGTNWNNRHVTFELKQINYTYIKQSPLNGELFTVPLNYNFIFTHVYTHGTTRKLQCHPVMCLHGPRFLITCNVHVMCRNTHGTKFTRVEQKICTRTFTHVNYQILLKAHSILLVVYPTNIVCVVDFHANIW